MHKVKQLLMEKLDIAADYYKNKELKDITPAVLDFMVKSTFV